MHYLFLIYRDEKQWKSLSSGERDAIERVCLLHEQLLQQQGYLLVAGDRPNISAALSVQINQGSLSLAEVVEPDGIVGFYLITSRDLNEAIQVASKMPQARYGAIVIRAGKEPEQSQQRQEVANRVT